jgi:putative DNA primase/helicase
MDRASAYAEAARLRELDRLRKAPVGQRNQTLNLCAFKLGQFVALGLLDASTIAAELAEAARLIGLEPAEIGPTIKSDLETGQLYPRRLPFSIGDSDSAEAAPSPAGAQDSLTKELAALGQTDADNAERFTRRFGHRIIYTPGRGFLTFDGTRWVSDSLLHSAKLAEETARLIQAEAQSPARNS